MVRFICPACHAVGHLLRGAFSQRGPDKELTSPQELAGTPGQCLKCNASFVLPPADLTSSGRPSDPGWVARTTKKGSIEYDAVPILEGDLPALPEGQPHLGVFQEDLRNLRRELSSLQDFMVQAVQTRLDQLRGKSFGSYEVNAQSVADIKQIVKDFGLRLLYQGQPVNIRCINPPRSKSGSIEVRTGDRNAELLHSAAVWPTLKVVRKAAEADSEA